MTIRSRDLDLVDDFYPPAGRVHLHGVWHALAEVLISAVHEEQYESCVAFTPDEEPDVQSLARPGIELVSQKESAIRPECTLTGMHFPASFTLNNRQAFRLSGYLIEVCRYLTDEASGEFDAIFHRLQKVPTSEIDVARLFKAAILNEAATQKRVICFDGGNDD